MDEVIHQPTRLRIMAALNALRGESRLEFTELRRLLEITDGNLGAHLATLEAAGYVQLDKDFVGRRPRTRVALTRTGRRAFAHHVQYLKDILDAAG